MQKQQHCTAHAAVEAWRSLAAAAAAVEAGAAAGRGGCLGCGAQCCAVLDSPSCRSCGSPAGTAPGRHPAPAAREARQAGRQQRVGGRRRCGCQRDGGKGRAQMHWACAAPAQTGAATTNQPPPTASTPPGTAPRCTHPPTHPPPTWKWKSSRIVSTPLSACHFRWACTGRAGRQGASATAAGLSRSRACPLQQAVEANGPRSPSALPHSTPHCPGPQSPPPTWGHPPTHSPTHHEHCLGARQVMLAGAQEAAQVVAV
jgi:hypothetical protein